ncbi:MAG: DUF1566 domain-containing protein [Magnetococcus sp. DMHC-6]
MAARIQPHLSAVVPNFGDKKMKMLKTASILAAVLFLNTGLSFAENATIPHTFTSGTKIISSEVNENFNTLLKEINLLKQDVKAIKEGTKTDVSKIPKTGQTKVYATGDDGDLQKGVAWPDPRFTDNGDGTVKDNLTGLIWLKNANCFSSQSWTNALSSANGLASGSCGLTDGSVVGDWRLPTVNELLSFTDDGRSYPPLPLGHPFSSVQTDLYWSSTTFAGGTSLAWIVYLGNGFVNFIDKSYTYYVWPVRGGY